MNTSPTVLPETVADALERVLVGALFGSTGRAEYNCSVDGVDVRGAVEFTTDEMVCVDVHVAGLDETPRQLTNTGHDAVSRLAAGIGAQMGAILYGDTTKHVPLVRVLPKTTERVTYCAKLSIRTCSPVAAPSSA